MTTVQLNANRETAKYYGINVISEYKVSYLKTSYTYIVVDVEEGMFNRLKDTGIEMSRRGEAFTKNVIYKKNATVINTGNKIIL